MDKQNITHIDRSLIDPSETNQRTFSGFDDSQISELAQSIEAQGIVVPLIVRPHPKKKGRFELVAGERRFISSEPGLKIEVAGEKRKLAGLKDLPCIVRELSDAQALEIQTIENLQRENLHEVEEAEGYAQMLELKENGKAVYNIESLALKLGKSVAFIYGRLKLLKMPKTAQEAFKSGALNASIALLIARIPDAKQAEIATQNILNPRGEANPKNAEPLSYRQAKQLIQENFMKRLKGAPFDQDNPNLVPANGPKDAFGCTEFGACKTCKFRTGNMKRLFPDIESSDVCTYTPCFQKKVAAVRTAEVNAAKKEGLTIVPDKAAASLFHETHTYRYETPVKDRYAQDPQFELNRYDIPYVAAEEPCQYHDGRKEKSWKEALGKHAPKPTVLVDPASAIHLVYERKDLKDACKKAGLKVPDHFFSSSSQRTPVDDEKVRKERAAENRKQKLKVDGYRAACAALAAVIHDPKPGIKDLELEFIKLMALSAAKQANHDDIWEYVNRRKLNYKDGKKIPGCVMHDAFECHVLSLKTMADFRSLLAEMLLMKKVFSYGGDPFKEDLVDCFKLFRIDHKAIVEKVKAADKERETKVVEKVKAKKEKATKKVGKAKK